MATIKRPFGLRIETLLFITFFALALNTAGCSVGPDYKPPANDAPTQFHSTSDTSPAVNLARWWTTFDDTKLNDLIHLAATSNYDLKAAAARIKETRALRRVALASVMPEVDATGSYSRSRTSEHITNSRGSGGSGGTGGPSGFTPPGTEQDFFQAGFDASWELDIWGGGRRYIEATTDDIDAAVEDERDIMVSLMAEVARNYVELRGSQRRLDIAHQNIKLQEDVLSLAESRYKAGLVNQLDVTQSKALLASTQAQIPSLETAVRQSIHRLGVLVGREPGALLDELEAAAPIPPAPPHVPAGLPSELLRRRPDVRRAERQLAAATARIGVATAELFPRVSLTGAVGLESISTSDFFTGGSRYWSFGPTMTWPIFAGGRIHANIAVANAREEQAKASYESAVLHSLEDTENALVAYDKEQTRRRSLQEAVANNQRSIELAQELYTRGLTPFLNVLQAQTALFQSQDDLAQSDRIVSTNFVALYKALGGGWDMDDATNARDSKAVAQAGAASEPSK